MAGLVDVVRRSPQDLYTLAQVAAVRANQQRDYPAALSGQKECKGYWPRIAGLAMVE